MSALSSVIAPVAPGDKVVPAGVPKSVHMASASALSHHSETKARPACRALDASIQEVKAKSLLREEIGRTSVEELFSYDKVANLPFDKYIDWLKVVGKQFGKDARSAIDKKIFKELLEKQVSGAFSLDIDTFPVFADRGKFTIGEIENREIGKAGIQAQMVFPKISYKDAEEIDKDGDIVEAQGDDFTSSTLNDFFLDDRPPLRIYSKKLADKFVKESALAGTIPWLYGEEGCVDRAHLLATSLKIMGINPKQIFFQYYIPAKSHRWIYHVAVAIKLPNKKLVVLDPSLNPHKSMKVAEWIKKFNAHYTKQANPLYTKACHFNYPTGNYAFHCPYEMHVNFDGSKQEVNIAERGDNLKYESRNFHLYLKMAELGQAILKCGFTDPYLGADVSLYRLLLSQPEYKLHRWVIGKAVEVDKLPLTLAELEEISISHILSTGISKEQVLQNLKRLYSEVINKPHMFASFSAPEKARDMYIEGINKKLSEIYE